MGSATGLSTRCDEAVQILGHERHGITSTQHNDFLKRVHPEDREYLKKLIYDLCPDNPSYVMDFRFIRPDGRQIWLEETAKGKLTPQGASCASRV